MKGLRDVHTQSVLKRERKRKRKSKATVRSSMQCGSTRLRPTLLPHGIMGQAAAAAAQASTAPDAFCSRCLSRVPSVSSHVEKLSQFESFHHFSSHITSSSSLSAILATPPYSPPPNSARAKPRLLHLTLPPRANTDHACRHLHLHLHLFADLSSHPLLHGTR